MVEPQGMAILSQISGSQNGKTEYVHPEGWKVWENVSALQNNAPDDEKNEAMSPADDIFALALTGRAPD